MRKSKFSVTLVLIALSMVLVVWTGGIRAFKAIQLARYDVAAIVTRTDIRPIFEKYTTEIGDDPAQPSIPYTRSRYDGRGLISVTGYGDDRAFKRIEWTFAIPDEIKRTFSELELYAHAVSEVPIAIWKLQEPYRRARLIQHSEKDQDGAIRWDTPQASFSLRQIQLDDGVLITLHADIRAD